MPKKKTTVRIGLYFALVAAMILPACNQNGAKANRTEFQASMAKLRGDLASGTTWQREKPFELRSFKPYLGDDWIGNAVAYGCYRAGQEPGVKGPSDAEILEDLIIMSRHWNLLRLYGADEDTRRILRLIDTNELPLKVVQGIWLENEADNPGQQEANINQITLAIELANQYPDIVIAVSVGNETQVFWSGHRMKLDNLTRYIRAVRDNVAMPVTTADDYLYWNKPESRQVAEEVDFVFSHIHPLWNGKSLEAAIGWMDEIYHELQEMHPDRVTVLGETGWATAYNPDETGAGKQGTLIRGEVGLDAQAMFLIDMDQWIESNQVTSFLFEAFDESWKGGGEDSPPEHVEKHWGVYYEDRTPKESFVEYLARRSEARD